MEKILITMNKNLLTRLDELVAKLGHGSNRSAFISEALEYYLLQKKGIMNIIRKKRLNHDLDKGNE